MKINESQRLSSLQAYRAGIQAKEAKSSSGSKGAAKDDVRISPEAKGLLEAQRLSASDREEKLEALKASVQSGTYRISAEQVAEKLYPYLK